MVKKKPWFILLAVLVLLGGASLFRWERTSTKKEGDLDVTYARDRWTGSKWIILSGSEDDKVYVNERIPYLASNLVRARQQDVLKRPEFQKRISEVEEKKKAVSTKAEALEEAHDSYEELAEACKKDWERENPPTSEKYFDTLFEWAELLWSPSTSVGPPLPIPLDSDNDAITFLKSHIPLELIQAENEYREYYMDLWKLKEEEDAIKEKAQSTAERELAREIQRKSNIATCAWACLLVLVAGSALYLYLKDIKSSALA